MFKVNDMIKKRLYSALCLAVFMIAAAGCSQSSDNLSKTPDGKSQKKELTIAYGLDTNAQTATGSSDMLLEMFTCQRLVELDGTRVTPSLAQSWDILENGKTIVFHLRKDVRFSDNTPFNADAVKFTYDRLVAFNSTSWTEIDRIEKLEIRDPHTVAVHYKDGLEGYVALTGFGEYHFSILSPTSVGPDGEPSSPIIKFTGTGPFQVADYQKDQYTVFVPNTNYQGPAPGLNKITVKTIPRAEARVLALQSGGVDVVVDNFHGGYAYTPRNLLATLEGQGFKVMKKEMPMTILIAFNVKKAPWNNPKVRQAINHAVNKDDLVALFDNRVAPAKTALFSDTAPYMDTAAVTVPGFDQAKARTLLKEAGFPEKAEYSLIAQGDNPDEVKLCELIKAQLADVGINIKLEVIEYGTYLERLPKGEFDLYIWYAAGPERRKFTRMDGRFNYEAPEFSGWGCYSDPEITAVIKKAVGSFDEEERKTQFRQFYRLLMDKAAIVPLYFDAVFVAAKPEVKGIEFISSEPRFDQVTIE